MSDQNRIEQEPKITWSYRELEDRIIEGCTKDRIGLCEYNSLPDRLTIGDSARGNLPTMLTAAIEARRHTDRDERHREHGKLFSFNPATRRIIIEDHLTQGDEISVLLEKRYGVQLEVIPKLLQDQRFAELHPQLAQVTLTDKFAIFSSDGSLMMQLMQEMKAHAIKYIGATHAHPTSMPWPISPTDIAVHLSAQEYISIVSVSQKEITALISTHQTPSFEHKNIDKFSTEHEQLIQQRIDQLLSGDSDLADRVMSDPIEYQTFVVRIREAMTRTLAKKFNLGYYRGDEDGVLKRVSGPQKK